MALFRQFWQYGYWKVAVIRKHRLPAPRQLAPFALVATLAMLAVATFAWRPAGRASWPAPALPVPTRPGGLARRPAAKAMSPVREPAAWLGVAWSFGCMHFGYGLGFARGLWASAPGLAVRRRRRPRDEAHPMNEPLHREASAVVERYAQRVDDGLPMPPRPEVMLSRQERERALVRMLRRHPARPMRELDALEIGCGQGDNLLEVTRLGADPARLTGNELLPERAARARVRLPGGGDPGDEGDALGVLFQAGSFDLILQSMGFHLAAGRRFPVNRSAARLWHWRR